MPKLFFRFLAITVPIVIVVLQLQLHYVAAPFAGLFLWILLLSRLGGRSAGYLTLVPSALFGNLLIEPVGQFSWQIPSCLSLAVLLFVGATTVYVVTRMRQLLFKNSLLVASLKVALQSRDDFVAIAGHELKSPFTALWLRAQFWQRRLAKEDLPSSASEQASLAAFTSSLEGLGRLIDNLLDVSRITAGKMELESEPVDIERLVRDVGTRFHAVAIEAGSDLQLCPEKGAVAVCDRLRTEQVLVNLLSNAIKYGKGKPIVVRSRRLQQIVELEVVDNGPGIPQGEQKWIFERFARGTQNTRRNPGLGIGLWVVRDLVENMNGTVRVCSREGLGATFTVSLPDAFAR